MLQIQHSLFKHAIQMLIVHNFSIVVNQVPHKLFVME